MSNAKLKEQIEAAKIALVHSAEAVTHADNLPESGTVKQIPNIGAVHAHTIHNSDVLIDRSAPLENTGNVDSAAQIPDQQAIAETQITGQDMIAQSDFEKLEARLEGLESHIKNQQRDLHTLLQKLRDITAKSQAVVEPKKHKGMQKWLVGVALCVMGFGAVYYWLGAKVITSTLYQITGFIVSLLDTLVSKI